MIEQTLDNWQNEMKTRFPKGRDTVAFTCPKCKRNNSIKEFEELNLPPDRAAQECIGRHDLTRGCDWASYGLFQTLGYGRIVQFDDGTSIQVFNFAEDK